MLAVNSDTGEILFGANDERYTLVKNQGGFPFKTLEVAKKTINFRNENIKNIYFSTKTQPFIPNSRKSKVRSLFDFLIWFTPKEIFKNYFFTKFYIFASSYLRKKQALKDLRKISLINKKVYFLNYHLCHSLSVLAFTKSSVEEPVLIFTLDGSGDASSGSVNIFSRRHLINLKKIHSLDSLGEIYSQMTALLNMKPMEHEFKLMGLSPYCMEEYSLKVYKKLIRKFVKINRDENENIVWKSLTGKWGNALRYSLRKELKYFRFDAIASGAQLLVEKSIIPWITSYVESTGIKNVGFACGVFMNVKLNKFVTEINDIEKYTFVPSSGDESLAFGSWIHSLLKDKNFDSSYIDSLKKKLDNFGLLIGNSYKNSLVIKEINESINNEEYSLINKHEEVIQNVAKLLLDGKIGARFAGRMEIGARSLGNRSIICSASSLNQTHKINKAIKSRDFWMPFAPVVLDTDAYKLFNIRKNSINEFQFMQIAVGSREYAQNNISAALHPYDKTARPQVLFRNTNPKFYELIESFKIYSGVGCLLNTSFNMHGFPVVESPKAAINVFINSGIDFLILENSLIIKNKL